MDTEPSIRRNKFPSRSNAVYRKSTQKSFTPSTSSSQILNGEIPSQPEPNSVHTEHAEVKQTSVYVPGLKKYFDKNAEKSEEQTDKSDSVLIRQSTSEKSTRRSVTNESKRRSMPERGFVRGRLKWYEDTIAHLDQSHLSDGVGCHRQNSEERKLSKIRKQIDLYENSEIVKLKEKTEQNENLINRHYANLSVTLRTKDDQCNSDIKTNNRRQTYTTLSTLEAHTCEAANSSEGSPFQSVGSYGNQDEITHDRSSHHKIDTEVISERIKHEEKNINDDNRDSHSKCLENYETSSSQTSGILSDLTSLSQVDDVEEQGSVNDFSDDFTDSDESFFSSDDSDYEFVEDEDLYKNQDEIFQAQRETSPKTPGDGKEDPNSKLRHIIKEFISTEKSYLQKLHLIDQEFFQVLLMRNQQESILPDEVISNLYQISSIYQLSKFLLKNLEKCDVQTDRSNKNRIGYRMKEIGPYLKIYSQYTSIFTDMSKNFDMWKAKSAKFAKFVNEIESKPICGNLSLGMHMLEPVQRIPRYELLLKEYLKHLPEESVDREDTQGILFLGMKELKDPPQSRHVYNLFMNMLWRNTFTPSMRIMAIKDAINLVTDAAKHCCQVIKRLSEDQRMVVLTESLSGDVDILSPSRRLIKEGKVIIISKKTGEKMERYLVLFNDFVLICKMGIGINLKPKYRPVGKISLNGLQVTRGGSLNKTFYLLGIEQVLEVCPSTLEESQAWIEALKSAISARSAAEEKTHRKFSSLPGDAAPVWIKNDQADMCMICQIDFNPVSKRKHHCRACGIVVCNVCSSFRFKLKYSEREMRVCVECHNKLNEDTKLCMDASDKSIHTGFLRVSEDMKTWSQYWFALREDALFSFKSKSVKLSNSAISLDGYQVGKLINENEMVFCLLQSDSKSYFFKTESQPDFDRWVEVLRSTINSQSEQTNSEDLSTEEPSTVIEKKNDPSISCA